MQIKAKQNKRRKKKRKQENEYTLLPLEIAGLMAAGVNPNVVKHGTKGKPGYSLLHPGIRLSDIFDRDQEEELTSEVMDNTYYGGFTSSEYRSMADPRGSDHADYWDPEEDELEEGQVDYIQWNAAARYVASNSSRWVGNFEESRFVRMEAARLAGVEISGLDPLSGESGEGDHATVSAATLMMGLIDGTEMRDPLYRGTFLQGADADEVEQAFQTEYADMPLASFTNSEDTANWFMDPAQYRRWDPNANREGVTVMYEVAPGAPGVIGYPLDYSEDAEEPEDDVIVSRSLSIPREVVSGGRFRVAGYTRDGNAFRVQLVHERLYSPTGGFVE